MCAALQHASTGGPVLIRAETGVGHAARSVTRLHALRLDELGFLAHATGLKLD